MLAARFHVVMWRVSTAEVGRAEAPHLTTSCRWSNVARNPVSVRSRGGGLRSRRPTPRFVVLYAYLSATHVRHGWKQHLGKRLFRPGCISPNVDAASHALPDKLPDASTRCESAACRRKLPNLRADAHTPTMCCENVRGRACGQTIPYASGTGPVHVTVPVRFPRESATSAAS